MCCGARDTKVAAGLCPRRKTQTEARAGSQEAAATAGSSAVCTEVRHASHRVAIVETLRMRVLGCFVAVRNVRLCTGSNESEQMSKSCAAGGS